ncbi:hypothetical protein OV203_22740 [Nannocystis sp. ILAH1]|uniref:hypothetical protein n=1 Tax=Nannocystis sp. ILAH1 TaxID=2996789 RepID=UPI002270EFB0|nr:hypothetical protein [Nannocystis sp. ILAH1]MCY0989974.1 hypothetical protein [Nannocystis sp. ILAH1]
MKVLDVIWAILRGIFWGIVDDSLFNDGKGPDQKERPWWEEQPPRAEPPAGDHVPKDNPAPKDRAAAPGWWAAPAPPTSPPTVKVETDAGTFVAATSFSGHHLMGIRRVESPRQEGESRRRRRAPRTEARLDNPTDSTAIDSAQVELRAQEPEVPQVTRVDVELRPREPDVPQAEPTTSLALAAPTRLTTAEPAPMRVGAGRDVAVPIEPGEEPRVARSRRVRSRLGPPDARGAPQLVTTLATRLALTACSPALSMAKKPA